MGDSQRPIFPVAHSFRPTATDTDGVMLGKLGKLGKLGELGKLGKLGKLGELHYKYFKIVLGWGY